MASRPERRRAKTKSRRYEVTASGVLYILVTMFLAVGAVNSQNNLLFWAFGVAVAAVIVSGMVSGTALMGLEVRREILGHQRVGEPLRVRYVLRNRNGYVPAMGLVIRDRVPGAWSPCGKREISAFVAHAPANRTQRTEGAGRAVSRGVYELEELTLQSGFPFGLFRKSIIFEAPGRLAIGPARLRLRRDVLERVWAPSRTRQELRASRLGMGDEVFGVREYVQGDSPRRMAWKRSAIRGRLVVRQTAEAKPRSCRVVLDRSLSGVDRAESELAIAAAYSCMDEALERGMSARLEAPWAGVAIEASPQGPSRGHLVEVLAALELAGGEASEAPVPAGAILISAGAGDASGVVLDVRRPETWLMPGERTSWEPAEEKKGLGARVRLTAAGLIGLKRKPGGER